MTVDIDAQRREDTAPTHEPIAFTVIADRRFVRRLHHVCGQRFYVQSLAIALVVLAGLALIGQVWFGVLFVLFMAATLEYRASQWAGKLVREPQTWEMALDDEGFHGETPIGSSTVRWASFQRAYRRRGWWVLPISRRMVCGFPESALTAEQNDAFAALLRDKGLLSAAG